MTDLSTAVLNVLWDDGEFVLSRAVRGEQLPPLLMMAPTSSRPAPDTVARLEHAYPLRDEDWGVRRFMLREPIGMTVNVLSHLPAEPQ